MAKKNKTNATQRERHNENVLNELLGEVEDEPDIGIEEDIANLGEDPDSDVKTVEFGGDRDEKKRKAFFAVAVFVIVFAFIGLFSSIRFIAKGISDLADNTALKNEFARFLLPVVSNDIAPFENESEITNSSKVSCAIWNIMVNKDTSTYKESPAGGILVPEYDVTVSCKEIFGSGASITHQTVGSGDSRFTYDEENHVYSCMKDLRYLNYAPRIIDMTENNGTYVLKVEYMPPSITMVADGLGLTVDADKTLEYTINRWEKKNTLMSVRLISGKVDNL